MQQDPNTSPFNALPPVVVALALAIMGVELVLWAAKSGLIGGTAGGQDWRIFALQRFAFSGPIVEWMIETGRYPAEHLVRFVSYPFVHGSFTQAVFACVFVLALGNMTAQVFPPLSVLVIFFGAAIVGALAYGLLLSEEAPLFGGFPAAYGLIGSYTFLLWVGLGARGENQYRAFTLIAFLLGIQLVFGLLFGSRNDWVADIAGFAAGFALSGVLAPGGWRRVLEVIRRR